MMLPNDGRSHEEPPNEKRPPVPEGAPNQTPTPETGADAPIVPDARRERKGGLTSPDGPVPLRSESKWKVKLPDDAATEALLAFLQIESELPVWEAVRGVMTGSPWPAPKTMPSDLLPVAYHGLAGEIVLGIADQTEAHPAAILLQFLCGLGTMIGAGPYHPVSADHHRAQLFVALVGTSGNGRKGASFGIARLLLREVDPQWADELISRGLRSGEALIDLLRDECPNGTFSAAPDKRLLFFEQEFVQVLKLMKRDGNTLSSVIRQLWDDGQVQSVSLANPRRATDAYPGCIVHVTPRDLSQHMQTTEAFNGFANRFLWLRTRKVRSIPHAEDLKLDPVQEQLQRLARIVERAKQRGEIKKSPAARIVWEAIYLDFDDDDDESITASIAARGPAYILRLSLVFALLDNAEFIEPVHLEAAKAIWEMNEASIEATWGELKGSPLAERIWRLLQEAPDGMSRTALSEALHKKKSKTEIDRAIKDLFDRGLVTIEERPTPGRAATYYHPNYLEAERVKPSTPEDDGVEGEESE